MGDSPRCAKCGGDQIATTIKDEKALCNKCAGLPSIADRLQELASHQEDVASRIREEFMRQRTS